MKKNLIFLVSMLCVSAALFLLRFTGLTTHIIVSVPGLAVMIPIPVMISMMRVPLICAASACFFINFRAKGEKTLA